MWARQAGWADATPEEGTRTYRELNPDLEFPPLLDDADEVLTGLLYTAGPGAGTGFGLGPLSWSEVRAFRDLTAMPLTPFEAEAIVLMSRAYVSEHNQASRSQGCFSPWTDDEEARQATVSDTLRAGLRGMVRAGG